jgi:hypothetical protein
MEDSMEAVVKEKNVKVLPKEKKPRAGSNVVAGHPSYLLVSRGLFFLVPIACLVLVLLNLYCGFEGESCVCGDGVSRF